MMMMTMKTKEKTTRGMHATCRSGRLKLLGRLSWEGRSLTRHLAELAW